MIQWKYGMLMHEVLVHFGGLNSMGATSIRKNKDGLIIQDQSGNELCIDHGDWIDKDGSFLKVVNRGENSHERE